MVSFEKGYRSGCHYVELNVPFTKDCVPVLYHDWTLESSIKIGDVENLGNDGDTYIYAIEQLTLEQFKESGLRTEYKTPRVSLHDVIVGLPTDIPHDVEIK